MASLAIHPAFESKSQKKDHRLLEALIAQEETTIRCAQAQDQELQAHPRTTQMSRGMFWIATGELWWRSHRRLRKELPKERPTRILQQPMAPAPTMTTLGLGSEMGQAEGQITVPRREIVPGC